MKAGDNIGRILVIEFSDHETTIFKEIVRVLERFSDFENLKISDESILSVPMLDIYLKQRRVFSRQKEISLTKKEYDLLCLLVINKGIVLTYDQLFKKLWDEVEIGDIRNIIGCHVRSLRRKLLKAIPNAIFDIQCIRSIGYRFDVK